VRLTGSRCAGAAVHLDDNADVAVAVLTRLHATSSADRPVQRDTLCMKARGRRACHGAGRTGERSPE
jgi:hypothetical protein